MHDIDCGRKCGICDSECDLCNIHSGPCRCHAHRTSFCKTCQHFKPDDDFNRTRAFGLERAGHCGLVDSSPMRLVESYGCLNYKPKT